jgi:hypothetical protein
VIFEEVEAGSLQFLRAVLEALKTGKLPAASGKRMRIPAKTRFVFVLSNKAVRLTSGRSGRASGRVRLNAPNLDAEKEPLIRDLISGARSIHVVPKFDVKVTADAALVSGGVTSLASRPDTADDWLLGAGAAALGLMAGP